MEDIAGVTTRGRVTIPKAMRDHLGWQPADKLQFVFQDGSVILKRISRPQADTTTEETAIDERASVNADTYRLEP